MNLCKTCGTICPFDDERTECDAYAPMTNENWFISLPTDEKAKWIANEINERVKLALHDSELNDGDVDADYYMEDADDWVEWLKQPHT
jgi:hypothetical protein